MQSTSGMNWSLLCYSMMSQCFWGMLPWSQIVHFFTICVLYSPDYIIYYCVSLLYYCQRAIMQNVTSGKTWSEHMVCTYCNINLKCLHSCIRMYMLLCRC